MTDNPPSTRNAFRNVKIGFPYQVSGWSGCEVVPSGSFPPIGDSVAAVDRLVPTL